MLRYVKTQPHPQKPEVTHTDHNTLHPDRQSSNTSFLKYARVTICYCIGNNML